MAEVGAWERGERLWGTGICEVMGPETWRPVGEREMVCVHRREGQLDVAGPAWVRERTCSLRDEVRWMKKK